jgi:hypothetical protein
MSIPSSGSFLVKPKSGRIPKGLTGEAAGSAGLFVVRSPNPSVAPRHQWDLLMHDYGDQFEFAAPVMADDQGRLMVPTGKIVVQFQKALSCEDVQEFAKSYGLLYLKTNEFAPNQVYFGSRNKEDYLPDMIARLQSDSRVIFAVPETMARYSRL